MTGCGSEGGIGFACASLLARLGARVAITSTTDRIAARAEELRRDGAAVFAATADLTDPNDAQALVAEASEELGPIEILVNNAGMTQTGREGTGGAIADLRVDALRRQLAISFETSFNVTQAALPAMRDRRYGRIVMVSSVTGRLVTAPGSGEIGRAHV